MYSLTKLSAIVVKQTIGDKNLKTRITSREWV